MKEIIIKTRDDIDHEYISTLISVFLGKEGFKNSLLGGNTTKKGIEQAFTRHTNIDLAIIIKDTP